MARPGRRIPPVTLYADKEVVETAFHRMNRAWICLHCRKEFSLVGSMGQLQCFQHPGFVQEDGRWSCCGKKQYPARLSENWPVQRMYSSLDPNDPKLPYDPLPKVRGCQKCDHNTSDAPFTFKDTMAITDLAALLPAINKKFPFHLREGFENGTLRRCANRKIVVPPNAETVTYMDVHGEQQEYKPATDGPIPNGIEICATDDDENQILQWQ